MQDMTNPVSLPLFYCMQDVAFLLTLHDVILLHFHVISLADRLHPSPVPHCKTFRVFLVYFLKCQLCFKCCITLVPFLNLRPFCW